MHNLMFFMRSVVICCQNSSTYVSVLIAKRSSVQYTANGPNASTQWTLLPLMPTRRLTKRIQMKKRAINRYLWTPGIKCPTWSVCICFKLNFCNSLWPQSSVDEEPEEMPPPDAETVQVIPGSELIWKITPRPDNSSKVQEDCRERKEDGASHKRESGTIESYLATLLSLLPLENVFRHSLRQFYAFSTFAMHLNELEKSMEGVLPPTDSRLRPDIRAMENGDIGRMCDRCVGRHYATQALNISFGAIRVFI